MKWFAAHIIMSVRLKSAEQSRFPVWENVVLIAAESERAAFDKAEEYGRQEEGDDDGTFRWGGRPARWVFAGVRKLAECAVLDARPDDGTEITFTELELDSEEAVKQLASGEPTPVKYNDRYRPPKSTAAAEAAKRPRRKRA